ncbi:MAG TPA: anti-sigma factor [Actinomycetales bacterium]|nr:anti-sigma factor [Actinomycetales bacterium]
MSAAADRHLGEETLALLALGEDLTDPEERAHLSECVRCTAELASLRDVVAAGREGGPLEAPPPVVWDRIAAELEATGEGEASARAADGTATPRLTVLTSDGRTGAPPVAPRRRGWKLLAAAAAGLVIGIAGTLLVQGPENTAQVQVLERIQLEPLPGWSQTGTAALERVGDQKVLRVDLAAKPPEGYREVWLMDQQVKRLVSVGILSGSDGTFVLPPGLDLKQFDYVDVSAEPFDGNPTHSGDSMARGRLA